MIQLTLSQIILSSTALMLLLGLIQWLLAKWLLARLDKSIQHEYDKNLEDYRFQQLQRQKAETIGCLFAKWIKYGGDAPAHLDKNELLIFYEDLNKMSLEVSLWLKDEKLLAEIMNCLAWKENAKDIRTLVGEIRKIIIGPKDNFDPQNIVLWTKK